MLWMLELTLFVLSVIGYNRELYKKWMNIDNFELIFNNLRELKEYVKSSKAKTPSKYLSFNN